MAFDEDLKEKRKKEILKRFIESNNNKNPLQKLYNYNTQIGRNLEAGVLSDNIIGDVSEENLARMKANMMNIPQSSQNLEAMKIGYEPNVFGEVRNIGRAEAAVEEASKKINLSNIEKAWDKIKHPFGEAVKQKLPNGDNIVVSPMNSQGFYSVSNETTGVSHAGFKNFNSAKDFANETYFLPYNHPK